MRGRSQTISSLCWGRRTATCLWLVVGLCTSHTYIPIGMRTVVHHSRYKHCCRDCQSYFTLVYLCRVSPPSVHPSLVWAQQHYWSVPGQRGTQSGKTWRCGGLHVWPEWTLHSQAARCVTHYSKWLLFDNIYHNPFYQQMSLILLCFSP